MDYRKTRRVLASYLFMICCTAGAAKKLQPPQKNHSYSDLLQTAGLTQYLNLVAAKTFRNLFKQTFKCFIQPFKGIKSKTSGEVLDAVKMFPRALNYSCRKVAASSSHRQNYSTKSLM